MNKCNKCGVEKPFEDFYLNARGSRDRRCKACQVRIAREWQLANPERHLATVSAHYAANKERNAVLHAAWVDKNRAARNEYNREWRRLNPVAAKAQRERHSAYSDQWAKDRPEFRAAKAARRKAANLRAIPSWANQFYMREAYDLARRRTKTFGFNWHVDHRVPLVSARVCGLHCEFNLDVIPGAANIAKSNTHWPDMP